MKVQNVAPHLPDFEEITIPIGVVDGRERFIYTTKAKAVDLPQGVAIKLLEQEDAWAPADAAAKAHVKAVHDERARVAAEKAAEAERQAQAEANAQADLVRAAEKAERELIKASEPAPVDAKGGE